MRKIFIDAGANDGCSVRRFRQETDVDNEYHVYSFEIDPDFVNIFNGIPNLTFFNKAVWIEDGVKEFYRDLGSHRYSGSLIKNKRTGNLDKQHPMIVDTVDFSMWVKDNFDKDDYIILKMDIEGAEYKVISKMLDDGTFDYINELWIEWHWSKIKLPKSEHDKLISRISIPTKRWCAVRWCKHGK